MLQKNTLAIWTVDQRLSGSATLYQQHLSSSELAHAKRFRFEKDRATFIIGRGILRHLLGYYTNKHPSEFQFEYEELGKPFLEDFEAPYFNISHSGNVIIMGFCWEQAIGVDVEKIKSNFDVTPLAEQNFSQMEIEALNKLNDFDRDRGFYRCWTRKESFIKAKGLGLSFPLDEFAVSLDDDLSSEVLQTKWDIKEKEEWQLISYIPADGYLAAVSVRDTSMEIEYQNWTSFKG